MSGAGAEPRSAPGAGQVPLVEGDTLPDMLLPNEHGRLVQFVLSVDARRPILLLCPDPFLPACRAGLESFARRLEELSPLTCLFAITNCTPERNARFVAEAGLPFSLLSDVEAMVARGVGAANAAAPDALTAVVGDVDWRILRILSGSDVADPAEAVLEVLRDQPKPEPRNLGAFAPVLHVPRVFEPEFCRTLIDAFERHGGFVTGVYQAEGGTGEAAAVVDQSHKVRRDFLVEDPVLVDGIQRRLGRRVLPAIAKAFTRQVTGVEEYKVVRYDSAEGGFFRAHRDNLTKRQAHRRFAMTLNLNTGDYEGGALRFPEFGPDLYAPGLGDAVIFSCSLLHEATPVTRGRRYALLTFMFDDESRRYNDRFPR